MRVVSLFSGAGGLDLGLKLAGHEIVWANDIFLDAAATYRANIGDHIDTRDICLIPSSEIPRCDVVVGGFPCQGFSVANWGRTTDDPRNQLFSEMVRVVREKCPRYFVAENVKGLMSMADGNALREITFAFSEAGYRVRHNLVNAADYGVPQFRKRLLILGVRNDLQDIESFHQRQLMRIQNARPYLGSRRGSPLGKPWVTFPNRRMVDIYQTTRIPSTS